jgi:hypothetical protein
MADASGAGGGGSRRRFLFTLAGGATAAAAPTCSSAARPATSDPLIATLTAFVDTLLPRDALTPAASELGVAAAVLRQSSANADYRRLVEDGCAWLDRAASGNFAAASPAIRVEAVTRMTALPWEAPPRYFYEALRQRALELYYSDPRSWGGLAIVRPPQPVGYPDHWK